MRGSSFFFLQEHKYQRCHHVVSASLVPEQQLLSRCACAHTRLEFRDSANAFNAISLYNGWKGWGHLGLAMKFVQPAPVLQQPMPKRERDLLSGAALLAEASHESHKQEQDGASPMTWLSH